ncbi:hypothetical protein SLS62_001714 [Diatrype stigma]|uniref:Pre-rRNA-processing protein RIX1 n=1 Tax=Diatrype stigma TaxID=117547 RepID=A0AAN9YVG4_9PEZI
MAFVALPPELRSLCRRLTSTDVELLPPLLPALLKDIVRCQEPLSRAHDVKGGEKASEATVLVNTLKTKILALLNGRTIRGHFVGAALVKAVIEAGGWECLRTCEPWVRALISILQILKPPVSSKAMKAPYSLIESVFESISTLLPLYPTTLRSVATKIRADARPYLAPTGYERAVIPMSLSKASRRLVIKLDMTAPKNGDAAEWAKHVDTLIKEFHATADQAFRPVNESWEPTAGYTRQPVNFDTEPQGGSDQPEKLPLWHGVQSGGERLIGIVDFIADYLRYSTRSAVTIPISAINDAMLRISMIIPPSGDKDKLESITINPAVGREERDDFWAGFPDIQVAALSAHLVLIQRLRRNFIPIAQETFDQVLRIFESGFRLPEIRIMAFTVINEVLNLCGPAMEQTTVEGLGLLIKSCCRDLLGAAGHVKRPKQQAATLQNGSKSKTVTQNADAFLSNKIEEEAIAVSLSKEHLVAAEALLATLFSSLPQQHLPSAFRIRMLRTAILCQSKDAQLASILHPSRDSSGRVPQVILPYLARQYPHDQDVELLRFSFRPFVTGTTGNFWNVEDDMLVDDEPKAAPATNGSSFGRSFGSSLSNFPAFSNQADEPDPTKPVGSPSPVTIPTAKPKESPFLATEFHTTIIEDTTAPALSRSPLKRKNDEEDTITTKRVVIENTETVESGPATTNLATPLGPVSTGQGDEDSDDESVHLNMELDSSSDEEEEEGEE